MVPLTSAQVDWMVAGGWAIDLFLGRVTRDHADLDLVVWRDQQHALHQALPGWTFLVADASALRPWHPNESLALPLHETHAIGAGTRLEFFLNDRTADSWTYRRDTTIRRQLSLVRHQLAAIPFLAPELVLLHKSKAPRVSDDHDFRAVAPHLLLESRQWLFRAIAHSNATHPWLRNLTCPEA